MVATKSFGNVDDFEVIDSDITLRQLHSEVFYVIDDDGRTKDDTETPIELRSTRIGHYSNL